MIDLEGYVILVANTNGDGTKLYGSPATTAGLEVSDEIVEVNGLTLGGCTHAQIIAHIHKCIRSKTICLRVRRNTEDNNKGYTVPAIRDAYVIAVEETARQRLEHLSSLHRVRPVDISKLHDLGNNNCSADDAGAVYVTTPCVTGRIGGESTSESGAVSASATLDSICELPERGAGPEEDCDRELLEAPGEQQQQQLQQHHRQHQHQQQHHQEHNQKHPEQQIETYHKKSPLDQLSPVCCDHQAPSTQQVSSSNTESTETQSHEHSDDGLIGIDVLESLPSLPDSGQAAENTMEMSVMNGYPNYNAGNMRHPNMDNPYEPIEPRHGDSPLNTSGPHNEMAVDVPSDYAYMKKEKPHLPAHITSSSSSTSSTPRRERRPESIGFTRGVPNVYQATGYTGVPAPIPAQMTPQEQRQLQERIKKYGDDLSKRRAEEERHQREEAILRNSLRGSKKLQALAKHPHPPSPPLPTGIENPNFSFGEGDETVIHKVDSPSRAATLPVRGRESAVDTLTKKPLGVEEVFASLKAAQERLRSPDDQKDLQRLTALLTTPSFQRALQVHKSVVSLSIRSPQPQPTTSQAQLTLQEVLTQLKPGGSTHLCVEELRRLLTAPHFRGLLHVHDKIATQRDKIPKTSAPEDDEREYLYERVSHYGEESIKIVRLQKSADPLGATVRNEGEAVRIGRIVKGGIAEKSGLLHEGDEILEINSIDIRNKSVNEVCDLMASLTGTLTFLISPSLDQRMGPKEEAVMHIRAHFDYDPEEDMYIPCKELGISFVRGDILHVINQEDPNWWQAYREGEEDQALAGLIPSRSFQEQRESIRHTMINETKDNEKKKHKCSCGHKHNSNKKKKKKLYNAAGEETDDEEILTYEEVARYYPQPTRKRPVVLIGPGFVGRQELRERLMESDTDRFAAAVPHTSRPPQEGEVDGKDYFFVPRHMFEADIVEHKFVEYGEFEKHLFGTSMDSIRRVVNTGKICILNLHPQSLRILKASDLKPYIVFIAPPNLDKLRQLRQSKGPTPTDTQLKEIIEKAREMEESYGHFFDYIITNFDHDRAFEELRNVINQLEVEPQWVPAHWVT